MKQIESQVELTMVCDAPVGVKDSVNGTLTRLDEKQFRFDEIRTWFGQHATQVLMRRRNLRISRRKDGTYRVAMTIPPEMTEPRAVGELLYAKFEQAQDWFHEDLGKKPL